MFAIRLPATVYDNFADYCRLTLENKESTIRMKLFYVEKFGAWAKDNRRRLTAIRKDDLEKYRAHLRASGINRTTTVSALLSIRSLYNFLYEKRRVKRHPFKDGFIVGAPGKANIVGHDFEKVIPRLLAACKNERERMIIMLYAATGCRRAELAELRWSDFSDDLSMLSVTGKTGQRNVVISDDLKALLAGFKNGSPYVFINTKNRDRPLRKMGLHKVVKVVARRAGLPGFTCHDFRRTYCTHLLEQRVDPRLIQELLGHKNLQTTLGYYSIIRADRLRRAADTVKLPI